MTTTVGWVNEHYTFGWYLRDSGKVYADTDPMIQLAPFDPIWHDLDGVPIYHPLRQRLMDHAVPITLCRTCGEPSFAVTRHARERHGVDVTEGRIINERPDWMRPDWL